MLKNIKLLIILLLFVISNCFKEWWEETKVKIFKYNK